MSRLLMQATEDRYFTFLLWVQSSKLSHMAFADDIMLFCKADDISIRLKMAFQQFSNTSALHFNGAKSHIYVGN